MPVFHPHGPHTKAMPTFARRGGVLATLKALLDVFREARAMEHDAYKRGQLINR